MEIDPSITARRWQAEAVQLWARNMKGIARVVTGGGKTVFAYLCMEQLFSRYPSGRVVVVVPTLALMDQWFVDICDATTIEESEVACYSGRERPDQLGSVNILVLNTARGLAVDMSESGPTMLVVDECHHAGAPENSRALEGAHEAALGLSATPERESDQGFQEFIVPALGPVIYSYDYPEAKADGVIVDFDLLNVAIEVDEDDVDRFPTLAGRRDRLTKDRPDPRDAERLKGSASKRVARATEHALRVPWAVKLALAHRQERIILFHERVASLARISHLLQRFGQNSVSYHSHMSESHRRDNLRLFRRGMVNVLVTCRALDEGANVPEANVAIVAHSTSSTRQRIQRLGRVLRPAKGKERARVYTLYAGEEQRARLEEEEADLEGVAQVVWKRGFVQ